MPGKKKGGKKKKIVRDEEWADNTHTFYAVVLKKAGGQHVDVMCHDGEKRKCYIRGKFRRRIWLDTDAVLLISYREELADDSKCDVIRKYSVSESNVIRSRGHLDFHKESAKTFGGYDDTDYDNIDKKEVQVRENIDTSLIPVDDDIEVDDSDEDEDDDSEGDEYNDEDEHEETEEEVDSMGNTIIKPKVDNNSNTNNTSNSSNASNASNTSNASANTQSEEDSDESSEQPMQKSKKFVNAKKAKDMKTIDPKKRQKTKSFKNNRS